MKKELEIAPWINHEDKYPPIPAWVNGEKKKSRQDDGDGVEEGVMWGALTLMAMAVCAAVG